MRIFFIFLLHAFAGVFCATVTNGAVPDSLRQRVDSLSNYLNSDRLEVRYASQFGIAYELFDVDNEMAVRYAEQALESARLLTDTAKQVKSGRLFGQLLRRVGELAKAEEVLLEVLPLSEQSKDTAEQGKILNVLSMVYNYQGRFDKAFVCATRLLRLREIDPEPYPLGQAQLAVGMVHYNMGLFTQAADYFGKATTCPDSAVRSLAYMDLALAKLYLNKLDEFDDLERQAMISCPLARRENVMMFLSAARGTYLQKKGEYLTAENHFRLSLNKGEAFGDSRMIAENLLSLSQCRTALGDYRTSVTLLADLNDLLTEFKFEAIRLRYYKHFADLMDSLKRHEDASLYRKSFIELKESMYDQEILNRVAVARVEFEEYENTTRIAEQSLILGLNQQVISRQRWIVVLSIGLTIVLLGLALMAYRFSKYQEGIARDLDKRVFERTRELEMSERAISVSLGEQKALMDMISGRVQSSVATFRGLWSIKHSGGGDPLEIEFEKAATDLLQVSRIIHRSLVNRGGLELSEVMREVNAPPKFNT